MRAKGRPPLAFTPLWYGLAVACSLFGGRVAAAQDLSDDAPWVPRCSKGPTLGGIDVSSWQGELDWMAVRASGVRFAYIRVSDGSTAPDAAFARNWAEAARAGVSRGAYQYFRPAEDPDEQADLFLDMVGALEKGDLPPALDIEASGELEASEIVAGVERWLRRVRRATTVEPVIYTNASLWASLTDNAAGFRRHALWIAHHDVACPNTPRPWERWTFHQASATASVPGIEGPVDENVFHGNARSLARLQLKDPAAARAAWRRWKRRFEREKQSDGSDQPGRVRSGGGASHGGQALESSAATGPQSRQPTR